MGTSNGVNKKIIIGGVIIIVVLAAALKVLNAGIFSLKTNHGGVQYENTGMMAQDSIGLPSGSLGMPFSKSGGIARESLSETPPVAGMMPSAADKKIIKNGNMTLQVDRIDDAAKEISEIAKANGGETFSSNFYQSSDKIKNGSMVVKVPVNNFEKAFDEIKKVATLVVRESTLGQDVTEQYTDLQSQLRNKQAEEQAIAKILEQSGKITDVLEVTRELSRVRGEIEILQGRIRFMDSRTDMATINVSLSEDSDVTIVDSWRPLQVAKDSVNDLIKNIQRFIDFVIVLVIKTIPVLILYLAVLGFFYWIGRKVYAKIKSRSKTE